MVKQTFLKKMVVTTYKHVCFECRTQTSIKEDTCFKCGSRDVATFGAAFRPPNKHRLKEWREVKKVAEAVKGKGPRIAFGKRRASLRKTTQKSYRTVNYFINRQVFIERSINPFLKMSHPMLQANSRLPSLSRKALEKAYREDTIKVFEALPLKVVDLDKPV